MVCNEREWERGALFTSIDTVSQKKDNLQNDITLKKDDREIGWVQQCSKATIQSKFVISYDLAVSCRRKSQF